MARDQKKAEIENRFTFHPATPETGPQHDTVRADLKRLAVKWHKTLPDGVHKSMAITKLQEAMFAANASIACDTGRDTTNDGAGRTSAPPAAKVDGRSKEARAAKAAAAPASKPVRRVTRRPSK